jgi:hypothetical protein
VGLVVEKVAVGRVFFEYFGFSCRFSFPPTSPYSLILYTLVTDSVVHQKNIKYVGQQQWKFFLGSNCRGEGHEATRNYDVDVLYYADYKNWEASSLEG